MKELLEWVKKERIFYESKAVDYETTTDNTRFYNRGKADAYYDIFRYLSNNNYPDLLEALKAIQPFIEEYRKGGHREPEVAIYAGPDTDEAFDKIINAINKCEQ